MNPKVSIVIPVYNGSNYLKEAIGSALAQTYKNVEIIVVNDGSNDNGATEKIAKSYGNKIKYYKKENGGVATALNLGIEKMTGEYFSWLSHDDLYYPDKIEKQIEFLSGLKDKKVILYSDFEVVDEFSNNLAFVKNDHYMLEVKPEYALLRGCVNGITLLIPAKAFKDAGQFNTRLKCTQDYDMWLRMLGNYRFVHTEGFITKTREHSKQDSAIHPSVIAEGNELWINMMERQTLQTKVRLEGSEYNFYLNMYLHLKKSPYKKAAEYAKNKATTLLKNNVRKQPLISVIIPCYNQGKFLDDAVNSVLQQTYKNFEIIVINDGSTDEHTKKILKKYKKPKTVVYETKNQGVTLTRNYGVTLAKGDLIQFLDADDYINENKLEYQANLFLADENVDVCYTSYEYYFVKDKQHKPPFHGLVIGENPLEDFLYRWQRGLSIPIHSAMFRTKLFEDSPPFTSGMKGSEDWIMWVDIASRGAKFALINEPLATYRVQEKSITLNGEHMFYWACRAVAYIADTYIKKADADKYDIAQQHYLKYLADYLLYSEVKKSSAKNSSRYRDLAKKTLPYKAARMLYRKGPSATVRATINKIGSR